MGWPKGVSKSEMVLIKQGKKRKSVAVTKKPESSSENGSDSERLYQAESSCDDSDRDEHWEPTSKVQKKKFGGREIKTAFIKLDRLKNTKHDGTASWCKSEKKCKIEGKEERKCFKINKMTFPEQLPLKKPSEREWEAVGIDNYGHMLPDPKSKWGLNFIVPHDEEKYFCDICRLACASRTGLVNHRKVHFRTLKLFDADKKPLEAKPEIPPSTAVTTAAVKPMATQPVVRPLPRKTYNAQGSQTEISGSFYQDNEESSSSSDKKEESTSETIYRLVDRGDLKQCVCGLLFTDTTYFFLHKGVHTESDPKKCALCGEKFKNYYEFLTHFYDHKHGVR